MGEGSPGSGEASPSSGAGSPNSGEASPNSGAGSPNSRKASPGSGEGSPFSNVSLGAKGMAGEISARGPPFREDRFHPRASARRSCDCAEPFPLCAGSWGRAPPSP